MGPALICAAREDFKIPQTKAEIPENPMQVYARQLELNARKFPEHVAFRLKTPGGYRQFTYSEA